MATTGEMSATTVPWVRFAGCVLVVAVLYWAQAFLVPIALAVLVTFVLARPVTWLQRWVGRVPAVLAVVAVVFSVGGVVVWGLGSEMSELAAELPSYRGNILQKIADVRAASQGGAIEQVQDTLEEISAEIEKTDPGTRGTTGAPLVVRSEQVASLWGFPSWMSPLLGPLATAGLVVALVVFMLLEREGLRDRLIGLIGHGHLAVTTRALDEAGQRVSRQLLMQTLTNVLYGTGVGIGLALLGVPYALLWSALGATLRFVPYLGPIIAAGAPLLVSLASAPGWMQPLWVLVLFVGLELFTNLVLETVLYAGAAGVSQVALLVAVAFWTWLWGPIGLLLATPLTACLVVLGRHAPAMAFLSTLMADTPALSRDVSFYQRLLARDPSGASELIDQLVTTESASSVYDTLFIPALNYAERDRLEARLSTAEEESVVEAIGELMIDAAVPPVQSAALSTPAEPGDSEPPRGGGLTVLGYPAGGVADELALAMLAQLLDGTPVTITPALGRMPSAALIATLRSMTPEVICLADLPPTSASRTRYLVKRLRSARPDATILVGRWACRSIGDSDDTGKLLGAGADHVSTTLLDSRDYLLGAASRLDAPAPVIATVG